MVLLFVVWLSTRRDVHSAPPIATMSSDSDKEVEEEEGVEEEDEDNFPHLSSGSSTGEENGNLFTFPSIQILPEFHCKKHFLYEFFLFARIIRGETQLCQFLHQRTSQGKIVLILNSMSPDQRRPLNIAALSHFLSVLRAVQRVRAQARGRGAAGPGG